MQQQPTLKTDTADPALTQFLVRAGLATDGEAASWHPLTGGVSSDIWRVDLPGRTLCVKRALAQLKVAAEWKAPTSRNAYEWAWIEFASQQEPHAVPRPLAHDPAAGLFAMEFLDPAAHPVWKAQLLDGHVDIDTAAAVGALLGRLHNASAYDQQLESEFATTSNFHALRLDPYLLATAERHPALAQPIREMVHSLTAARIALVHGDVSPKNILVGPRGPVFLDAECAWFGDPAFDLAFCLNHLMLKCIARPDQRFSLLASFARLSEAYFDLARWEPRSGENGLEGRSARLLPMLFLARVDGKSPVEYLTGAAQKDLVRRVAIPLIERPVTHLHEIGRQLQLALDRQFHGR
ncbi:phosphotransferase family protein [Noviherbaspirillum sp. Root189]|uniref:phosphotransferase family protein n=1 Tax=Noviherbaspirillum sp. Root189 TaxID=1736487 RepID=UPI00070BEF34|nr:aminoglycoside phosphotransferase family protein [Noviherbaspirillum sp. Root189]KRB93593.1 aminoglycoside phosphotransferase [Noviherbaspirillum sp. Root189]